MIGGENVQGDENLQRTQRDERRRALGDVSERRRDPQRRAVRQAVQTSRSSACTARAAAARASCSTRTRKSADNYGVELELRKDLGALGAAFEPLTVFSNVTVMESQIHLFDSTQAAATNLNRAWSARRRTSSTRADVRVAQRRLDRDAAVQPRRRAHHGRRRLAAARRHRAAAQRARLLVAPPITSLVTLASISRICSTRRTRWCRAR